MHYPRTVYSVPCDTSFKARSIEMSLLTYLLTVVSPRSVSWHLAEGYRNGGQRRIIIVIIFYQHRRRHIITRLLLLFI